jgi:hypothetical protein
VDAHRPHVAAALALALALVAFAWPAAARAGDRPIQDNSFLVEEAYNQEPGVIQHVGTFERGRGGGWEYAFTEEWPVLGQTHQASITARGLRPEGGTAGVGDLALNYRLQAFGSGDTPIAFSPRLTALLPTGDAARGRGAGGAGVEVNLPISLVVSRFVTHVNAGWSGTPSARAPGGDHVRSTTFSLGDGIVWLAHPKLNVLVEGLYTTTRMALPGGSERTETFTLNPGVRTAFDFANGLQIVPGVSFPFGVGPSEGERAVFLYLSLEHPFRLAGSQERT